MVVGGGREIGSWFVCSVVRRHRYRMPQVRNKTRAAGVPTRRPSVQTTTIEVRWS